MGLFLFENGCMSFLRGYQVGINSRLSSGITNGQTRMFFGMELKVKRVFSFFSVESRHCCEDVLFVFALAFALLQKISSVTFCPSRLPSQMNTSFEA